MMCSTDERGEHGRACLLRQEQMDLHGDGGVCGELAEDGSNKGGHCKRQLLYKGSEMRNALI